MKFVEENNIKGVLIQSMFFTPGTPSYDESKDLKGEPEYLKSLSSEH